jgi:hypothetical protein
MSGMKRREFIAMLGSAAAWPGVAARQGPNKRPVIGMLGQDTPSQLKGVQLRQYFFDGLRELGYVQGRDFDIVGRLAESTSDLPRAAKELVQLNPDVIVATASANALAAKMATSTIPIVVPALGNPIALGLIELAFQKFDEERAEVAIVFQSNLLFLEQASIAAAAAATRLPSVYGYRVHVDAGGLISYGVDLNACVYRAATYVHKILNGARCRSPGRASDQIGACHQYESGQTARDHVSECYFGACRSCDRISLPCRT